MRQVSFGSPLKSLLCGLGVKVSGGEVQDWDPGRHRIGFKATTYLKSINVRQIYVQNNQISFGRKFQSVQTAGGFHDSETGVFQGFCDSVTACLVVIHVQDYGLGVA
jgi:hypothetical protein